MKWLLQHKGFKRGGYVNILGNIEGYGPKSSSTIVFISRAAARRYKLSHERVVKWEK